MELNNVIINIENKKQAEIIVEIFNNMGIMFANKTKLVPEMRPSNTVYIVFGKLMKVDSIEKAKAVFKNRTVVSSVEVVNAIAPDFMLKKINESHINFANKIVNRRGNISFINKPKGIKVETKAEFDTLMKKLSDIGIDTKGIKFKANSYVCFKKEDGANKVFVNNEFDADGLFSSFELVKDKIGVDLTEGAETLIDLDFVSTNNKAFKCETDDELESLLSSLSDLGATWVSGSSLTEYNFGTDVYYGVYVSNGGKILVFYAEITGDDTEIVNMSELTLTGKADKKPDLFEKEVPLMPVYNDKSSRIGALKAAFPGKYDDIEVKGFRFGQLPIKRLREILLDLKNDARYRGCFEDNVLGLTKNELVSKIYSIITKYVMGL